MFCSNLTKQLSMQNCNTGNTLHKLGKVMYWITMSDELWDTDLFTMGLMLSRSRCIPRCSVTTSPHSKVLRYNAWKGWSRVHVSLYMYIIVKTYNFTCRVHQKHKSRGHACRQCESNPREGRALRTSKQRLLNMLNIHSTLINVWPFCTHDAYS